MLKATSNIDVEKYVRLHGADSSQLQLRSGVVDDQRRLANGVSSSRSSSIEGLKGPLDQQLKLKLGVLTEVVKPG